MTSSEHDSRASRSAGPRSLSPETLKRGPRPAPAILLRTVLAVSQSQCECDLGRRRWRACSLPVTDRIGNGFHSTRYMCPWFYGPRLSSRRKPVDDTKRLIRGREGERGRKNKLLPLVSLSRTMTVAGIECPRTCAPRRGSIDGKAQ